MVAPGSGWSLPQVAFTFRHHVTPDLARIDCTATCVPGLFVKSTNKHQTDLLHIAATSSSCYICSLVSSSPSWCRQSLWSYGRCRSVHIHNPEALCCGWKKKQVFSLSWICLQNLPPPVLPVVILIIEGASFKNLKIARSENGIVNDGTLLEARWLGKALIMWCRLLLVAGRVAPRLMELLAGLVLKIQLYCLVTTLWVVYWTATFTEKPSLEVDVAQGQFSVPLSKFYSNDKHLIDNFPPRLLDFKCLKSRWRAVYVWFSRVHLWWIKVLTLCRPIMVQV